MRIAEIRKIEDCFDGSSVYGYSFEMPWKRDDILSLTHLGTLEFFTEFPRPFFRLLGDGGFQVKGVQGDATCRVIFPRLDKEQIKIRFERLLQEHTCDEVSQTGEAADEQEVQRWA